jgi:Glutathione S-transferase, N-terminal domain
MTKRWRRSCPRRSANVRAVILYTCTDGKSFGGLPGPLAHPCGKAAKALDEAGHSYELRQVKGGTLKVWTWPSRAQDRAEVERLSGQRGVPILVLDDGEVIAGSGNIVHWARENLPAAAAPES